MSKTLIEQIIEAAMDCIRHDVSPDWQRAALRNKLHALFEQHEAAPEPPALESIPTTAEKTAAEMMVAARNARMFQDVRSIVATCADRNARAPYRHVEAQRVLPLLDAFLGEGYTGRVMAFKRALTAPASTPVRLTDDQIAAMFERVTGYSIENGRAALNDADILGFARELLEAARAGGA